MRPLPDLPVLEIADAVNRALADAPCLVVTAPPGAGKSTVLPLTILDGGNHSLEIADPMRNLEILRQVMKETEKYINRAKQRRK